MSVLARFRTFVITMAAIPTCCLMASSMIMLFLSTIFMGSCVASSTTTTTPAPPFYQTSMFIGLTAGIGGFIALLILVCIIWKCTCGGN